MKCEEIVFVLIYMAGNEHIVGTATPAFKFAPLLGNPGHILALEGSSEVYKKSNVLITSTWALLVFKDGQIEEQKYLSSDYQGSLSLLSVRTFLKQLVRQQAFDQIPPCSTHLPLPQTEPRYFPSRHERTTRPPRHPRRKIRRTT